MKEFQAFLAIIYNMGIIKKTSIPTAKSDIKMVKNGSSEEQISNYI